MKTKKENIKLPISKFEAMDWYTYNCGLCSLQQMENTKREFSSCKLSFDIELSLTSGEVPLPTAEALSFGSDIPKCKYLNVGYTEVCKKNQKKMF